VQVGQQRVREGGTGGPVDAALGQLLDGVVQRRPAVRKQISISFWNYKPDPHDVWSIDHNEDRFHDTLFSG